jgi:hypothetical protein
MQALRVPRGHIFPYVTSPGISDARIHGRLAGASGKRTICNLPDLLINSLRGGSTILNYCRLMQGEGNPDGLPGISCINLACTKYSWKVQMIYRNDQLRAE